MTVTFVPNDQRLKNFQTFSMFNKQNKEDFDLITTVSKFDLIINQRFLTVLLFKYISKGNCILSFFSGEICGAFQSLFQLYVPFLNKRNFLLLTGFYLFK